MTRHLLTAIALCCAVAGANATPLVLASPTQGGLSIANASAVSFEGYDGSATLSTGTLSQGYTGTLTALTAGTISFTFLGHESTHANVFNFQGKHLVQSPFLGSSRSGKVDAGVVKFSFTDWFDLRTYANGGNATSMVFAPTVNTAKFGAFDFVIGFNDKRPGRPLGDIDFDDFVVGVKFKPNMLTPAIPEPSTWALMGLGLAGIGAVARRRG